ncbi:MraY family glycosyltransferase [Cytophagales bacterium LB-30]|uniref:MraY family glycosyltransferase n=1 Tax=Shiella aurantiaca TaxID=3058365 RepID=A0ABT8F342_9BACT|nr:MraY family glycosyltransferase [Shiella aurantiaca]MDN4164636.1 MraY family glycosyltransferase [Shiella aurantiaca]
MPLIIASLVTAFLITFLFIPVIIKIFKKKKIFDKPGGRKIHKVVKPSMGGIPIFIGIAVALFIWMPFDGFKELNYLYGALLIVFITGVRDDLIPLKPLHKLIGIVTAAFMVVYLCDIRLNSLYGIFGIYEMPLIVSYVLSVFTIIVITNAINLIDGLDGLAGSISTIILFTFGVWFYAMNNITFSIVIFAFIGSLIAFLNFNWEPSKIFMGDTGALLLGFFISVVTIDFIHVNHGLPHTIDFRFDASVSAAICVIIMPLFDTLRVFISRMMRGKSPFSPDKTHIHHMLLRMGMRHSQAVLTIGCVNLIFIGIAYLGKDLGDHIMLPLVIGVTLMFSLLLDILIKRRYFNRN